MDFESYALLANVGAVITLGLGCLGLFAPNAAAAFTSMQPEGLIGRSEVRATYGGFFFAIGATCLWLQSPTAFTVAGLAWCGAAVGRAFSVVVDKSTSSKNVGGILFEAVIGALLLLGSAGSRAIE